MRKRAACLMMTVMLLGATQFAVASVRDLNTIKEGDVIPVFKGRNLVGEEVDVGALIGKKVIVLAFWSIYCKPCVEEISSLIRLQEQLGGEKLEVVGINADSELGVARIRTFMSRFEEFERKKINYSNIFDEGNTISKLLGVGFLPTVVSVNLKGQVEKVFMGFEEKSEPEIFAGIRKLLPPESGGVEPPPEDQVVFAVEGVAPLCGFYDASGWKGNFQDNYDLSVETELMAEIARRKALKAALREALVSLGVDLLHGTADDGCFLPYGVLLRSDPFQFKDCLTNLLRELPAERLAKVVDAQEDNLGDEYHVNARYGVDVAGLRSLLETMRYQFEPRTVTFSVINLRKMDQAKFERAMLQQSRYIGFANFPTVTVYTTTEEFAREVEHMDFGNMKLFVEEAGVNRIELEVWR